MNERDITEKGLIKNVIPITNPNISSEVNFPFKNVLFIVMRVTSIVALSALIGKFKIKRYVQTGINANQLAYDSGILTTFNIF